MTEQISPLRQRMIDDMAQIGRVLAAIDMLSFTQAEMTEFLLDLGPQYATPGGEGISVLKRLNELKRVYDTDPEQQLADGELLRDVIVERAVSFMPRPPEGEWGEPQEKESVKKFRAALERDGVTIVDGKVRRDPALTSGTGQFAAIQSVAPSLGVEV